jgi:hypothetical protein
MIPFAKELTDAQIEKLITFFSQYHEEEIHQTTEHRIKGDGGS